MSHLDTSVRIDESQAQALRRLLEKARAKGIKLCATPDGRHFATSSSAPGRLHYVTGYSCDCQGFARHQRCMHYAALLSALGWLELSPAPAAEPTIKIEVRHTEGHYSTAGWLVGNGTARWNEPLTTIFINGEERIQVTGDQFDVRATWLSPKYLPSDVTGEMADGVSHCEAVRFWVEYFSNDASINVTTVLQDAGVLPDNEFIDDRATA